MNATGQFVASAMGPTVASLHGLLTGRQAAKAAGISYRMLDLWTHRGLITPAIAAQGSGSARLWSPEVVGEIAELKLRMEACPFHPHSHPRRK